MLKILNVVIKGADFAWVLDKNYIFIKTALHKHPTMFGLFTVIYFLKYHSDSENNQFSTPINVNVKSLFYILPKLHIPYIFTLHFRVYNLSLKGLTCFYLGISKSQRDDFRYQNLIFVYPYQIRQYFNIFMFLFSGNYWWKAND